MDVEVEIDRGGWGGWEAVGDQWCCVIKIKCFYCYLSVDGAE